MTIELGKCRITDNLSLHRYCSIIFTEILMYVSFLPGVWVGMFYLIVSIPGVSCSKLC